MASTVSRRSVVGSRSMAKAITATMEMYRTTPLSVFP
jgi:hypothetical protein